MMANPERLEDAGNAKEIYLRIFEEARNFLATCERAQRDLSEQLTALEELYADDPSPALGDTLAEARGIFFDYIRVHPD
jgi:hypothetical protein